MVSYAGESQLAIILVLSSLLSYWLVRMLNGLGKDLGIAEQHKSEARTGPENETTLRRCLRRTPPLSRKKFILLFTSALAIAQKFCW